MRARLRRLRWGKVVLLPDSSERGENWLDAHRDWSGSPDCNPPVQTLIPEVCVSLNYECEPTFTYKSMFSLPQSSESQVKKKRIKSCFRETFGQHQGPTSSAFEDLKRQKNYWQCWISQVALKCSVSLKVCSQMKQQSNEQFWHVVNYERERDLIRIMHLLSLFPLTNHCHTINRDIHVPSAGVWCLCSC